MFIPYIGSLCDQFAKIHLDWPFTKLKSILQDLHLRESRIATVVKEVKDIMVLIIVAVESGEDIM